jgi:sugar phosphate permease
VADAGHRPWEEKAVAVDEQGAQVSNPDPVDSATSLPAARWKRLLPVAFVTYSFAYLDRSNYAIGAPGGLEKTLHITSTQSGLLGGLFFIGYFLFQVPAGDYAERHSVRRLMFWSLLAWGVLAALQGVLPSFGLLLADRFLLGVVEAVVLPTMLVFLSHWFTRPERGRADAILILGNPVTLMWMSVVSGYLIAATSWRWMFIIEGAPAIVWAFIFRAVVDDRPEDAAWLAEHERDAVNRALDAEDAATPQPGNRWALLRSPAVVVLSGQYLLWSIGVYGFVFWLPTIVAGLTRQGIGTTGALSAVPYAAAVLVMLGVSRLSDGSGRRRGFVWLPLAAAAAAFYASYLVGNSNFTTSFILLIVAAAAMYAPYGPYFAFIPELLPRASAGPATGLINAFGGLGGFAGTYLVGWLGGGTGAAFIFLASCLLASALLMFLVRQPATMSQAPSRHTTARSRPGTA